MRVFIASWRKMSGTVDSGKSRADTELHLADELYHYPQGKEDPRR